MTEASVHFTEHDPRSLLGAFLRARTSSAKDLARRVPGMDPRSAETYRAGRYWPQAKHWPGIIAAFGRDVTEAVFHPEAAIVRLEAELREHERQAEEARAALRALARRPSPHPAGEATAAVDRRSGDRRRA